MYSRRACTKTRNNEAKQKVAILTGSLSYLSYLLFVFVVSLVPVVSGFGRFVLCLGFKYMPSRRGGNVFLNIGKRGVLYSYSVNSA